MTEDFDSDKDAPNIRVVPFGKNKILVRREDPFGFWSVAFERGSPPEWMKGSYTSYDYAFSDIQKYLSTLKDNEKEVPSRPVDTVR